MRIEKKRMDECQQEGKEGKWEGEVQWRRWGKRKKKGMDGLKLRCRKRRKDNRGLD